ncbi:hypothetical protein [Streptomyces sp. URMC 123]|uniref:hypothetical protein n=1 Tax=Streptomyces sp. URMC 123 TaxID=3423403 RepID=UPI003F1B9C23
MSCALRDDGFDHVLFADNLHRLEPLLKRASGTRRRELGQLFAIEYDDPAYR